MLLRHVLALWMTTHTGHCMQMQSFECKVPGASQSNTPQNKLELQGMSAYDAGRSVVCFAAALARRV